MSRWSIFWYFKGNFWSKRRKSRWRSARWPYWISDKKLSGFRILVQRPSNTPKIIKIGQPCLWTYLHGFLVDTLLNRKGPWIWQVQEWIISTLEQMQVSNKTELGVRRSERLLLSSRQGGGDQKGSESEPLRTTMDWRLYCGSFNSLKISWVFSRFVVNSKQNNIDN